jgi:hypothetical protein
MAVYVGRANLVPRRSFALLKGCGAAGVVDVNQCLAQLDRQTFPMPAGEGSRAVAHGPLGSRQRGLPLMLYSWLASLVAGSDPSTIARTLFGL